MNVCFCCRFLFTLVLFTSSAFSQSTIKSKYSGHTQLAMGRWDLGKFIWSTAKYKPGKYDKPILDFNAIDNWQRIGDYLSVSHNGKYFAYTIERGSGRPFDRNQRLDSLIVQSVDNSSRLAFVEPSPGFFSDDSRQYVFQEGTTLCFLQLNGSPTKYVKDISSYKVSDESKGKWLAYQLKNGNSDVVLQDLITGKERIFRGVSDYKFDGNNEWFICRSNANNNKGESNELLLYQIATGMEIRFPFVVDYLFSESGKAILLKTSEEINNGETANGLGYVSFPEKRKKIIWSTKLHNINIHNYSIDKHGEQVAFSIRDSSGFAAGNLPGNSIWYYKKGMEKAIIKITNETADIDKVLQIEGSISFSDNGRYIQFSLLPKPSLIKQDTDAIQLEVWNHKDLILQSAQTDQLKRSKVYNGILNIKNERIIQLESEGRTLHLLKGDYAIVKKLSKDTYGDRFWEEGYGRERDSNWLVSLSDGSRHLLESKGGNATEIGPFWFSPSGNYLVYFDYSKECNYFSYDLRTGRLRDISASNNSMQLAYVYPDRHTDKKSELSPGLAAWMEGDAGVLVYDNNDIWQFDLQGKKPAINLTNGFRRSHNIIFSLSNSRRFADEIPVCDQREPLLLRAFDTNNKHSGFYKKNTGVDGDPELLYMGKYFMNMIPWCQDPNLSKKGMQPIKARDVDFWIVQRQSDTEAPNYYKTTNFQSFEKLTDFQPQKGYNWLFEELHSFKHLGGTYGQGVLYKPENFDSSKKYPVLIILYGGYSNNLYQFPMPAYNIEAITPGVSPIWFLNNGYLIFTPDIYVSPLKYGPEAFNVIEGAVRYLKQLPYVDANKLGCCSHSWSAKLGAYLFTHSKSFGATSISEGFLYGNMISSALSDHVDGASRLEEVEEGFEFGNLWKNKDSWLDQTTVFNADNANSPLLLFCNNESTQEMQNQTLQIFTALRRLEKKTWWLKYDKGGHILTNLDEQKDFTIRNTQFFDHYLKEAPAPHWMTQGIPASFKGFETGYELDPRGSCGKDCKICEKWNTQYKKYPEIFSKPIGEWHLD